MSTFTMTMAQVAAYVVATLLVCASARNRASLTFRFVLFTSVAAAFAIMGGPQP